MNRSTPEGLWMVHTPGAKKKKEKAEMKDSCKMQVDREVDKVRSKT